jgi:hypothetical protein
VGHPPTGKCWQLAVGVGAISWKGLGLLPIGKKLGGFGTWLDWGKSIWDL